MTSGDVASDVVGVIAIAIGERFDLLLGFILVHLTMVLLAGPINEIGSMITGRFSVPPERSGDG